jgi:elongator complex protein 3
MSYLKLFIQECVKRDIHTGPDLQKLKNQYCEKYKLKSILNIDLLNEYNQLLNNKVIHRNTVLESLFKKRGVRTLSGISPITVLTKPFSCPGTCIFCPAEPDMPKSYLSNEPAVQRAILNQWNGLKQIHNRLRSLQITGHNIEKNELIVAGGTWSYYPKQYQQQFIKSCFDGFNTFPKIFKHIIYTETTGDQFAKFTTKNIHLALSKNLEEAKKKNEQSTCRVIGMSLETRPDYINPEEIIRMRSYGCTRVQLGVQSTYDDVLKRNKRGHGVKESIQATRLLKDAGLKVDYHMMPGLLGATKEKDIAMFQELFQNPDFQPDQLKIYPCSIVPYSALEQIYKKGQYQPYSEEELIDILSTIKTTSIPPYVRISRLIRDIPSTSILAGSKRTNLRQLIQEKLQQEGKRCRCIRCREVRDQEVRTLKPELIVREYSASGGKEYFISFEDTKKDVLFGFCRLRIPSQMYTKEKHYIKELEGASIVRELHVYGIQVPIDTKEDMAVQHFGFGKKLMKKAEEMTKILGIKKIAVTSGIGVRAYYRKLGYKKQGEYMIKKI